MVVSVKHRSGRDTRTKVCLFAKTPVAGRVKTRMSSSLSEQECLQLHLDLLACVAANVAALPAQDYVVELHITGEHSVFDALSERYGFCRKLQVGQDLGQRMSHAVSDSLREYEAVLLVGADCPFVDGDVIAAVLQAGQHNRAVMVPAADGGYVALLLRDHDISLFSDIAWGRESVARTTISRLQALRWDFSVLPGCPDIDRPEDLNCLVEIPALAHWAKR